VYSVRLRVVGYAAALLVMTSGAAGAQDTRTPPAAAGEAAALAKAWDLLARNDLASASAAAGRALAEYPRSSAALALAIDVECARNGSRSALTVYEQWLGGRTTEDAYALRRVAVRLLREAARNGQQPGARDAAIQALAADGETHLTELLGPGETVSDSTRARAGDRAAVDRLIAAASGQGPAKANAVRQLASAGSRRAVPVLTQSLQAFDPIVRAEAARALGVLGAKDAIPALKPLLNDPNFNVHISAAEALTRLGDTTSRAWLRQLMTNDEPAIRVTAASAASSDPDPEWIAVVRSLTGAGDPEVRRQAAELIAPHDPKLASDTLQQLLSDPNPAERQAATDALITASDDVSALRKFLRDADAEIRVHAADRLLQITR
jgi:HEAT repeat protein